MSQNTGGKYRGICLVTVIVVMAVAGLASAQLGMAESRVVHSPMESSERALGRISGHAAVSSGVSVTKTVHLPAVSQIPSGQYLNVWADSQRAPILRAIARIYKREHGVDLLVREVENMREEFMDAISEGAGPDVIVGPHDQIGYWLTAGLLAPIKLEELISADFAPVALSGFASGGQLYGLPYAFENMGLFRNVDLVPAAPETFDDLLAIGQALQASGMVSYTLALEDNGYKVYPIVTSFGGYVFGRYPDNIWNVNDLGIDGQGMIAAGEWISDSVGAGLVSPVAHDGSGAQSLFVTGQVPFIMTGPWALSGFMDSGVNYAISAFPDNGRPFVSAQGFMISADSTKTDLAQEFLTGFVATGEIMEMLYQHDRRPPAYLPLLATISDPDLADFFDAAEGGAPMPSAQEIGCVWSPWNEAIVRIITGQERPDLALTGAAEDIRDCIMGKYKGMVNVPGSYQTLVGCERNWDPACLSTAMTKTHDGLYTSTHVLPAGAYEVKVALDGNWQVNFGLGGVLDGENIPFILPSASTVNFTFDPESHILTVDVGP